MYARLLNKLILFPRKKKNIHQFRYVNVHLFKASVTTYLKMQYEHLYDSKDCHVPKVIFQTNFHAPYEPGSKPFRVSNAINIKHNEQGHKNHSCPPEELGTLMSTSMNTSLNTTDESSLTFESSSSLNVSENRRSPNDQYARKRSGDKRRYNQSDPDLSRSPGLKKFSLDEDEDEDDEEDAMSEATRDVYGSPLPEFLDTCFNKRYSFKSFKPHNMRKYREAAGKHYLYTFEKWKHEDLSEFQKLKLELNSVKEKLNEYNLNEWHRHTRSTNPADLVMRRLRTEIKVEFLTQAWCKFYELVSEFHLIPKDAAKSKSLYTIHLCEAPGAFVASLNHYLKLNYPDMDWHWEANSLNPYYEGNNLSHMINDDRFMLQTIDKWDFGPDMTGDITHPDYPDHLLQRCGEHLPHLVTADGSFDCQDKPEEQEMSVSWLHLKETLTALRILRKGGHFVIKMFTFFECDTICLLFLLGTVFESVNVMKPATSKEGNSEVYVVCREFKGVEEFQPYFTDLQQITLEEHLKYAMFPYEHISRAFPCKVLECAKQFAAYQVQVIERNLMLFPHRQNEQAVRRPCAFVQGKLWENYVKIYKLAPISHEDNIVPMPQRTFVVRKSSVNVMEKRERKRGSHADEIKRRSMDQKEIVDRIFEELNSVGIPSGAKKSSVMPDITIQIQDFKVNLGKQINIVVSSQFCHGTYIRMRNELMSAVSIDQFNIFAVDPKTWIGVDYDARKLCDFGGIFMRKTNYCEAQLDSFRKIHEKLLEMVEGEDLVLISYPLLTQFNVNVLCFLKQIFDEIEFRAPSTLYLNSINIERRNRWMPKMDEILRQYTKSIAVISFLPLSYITGIQNPVYSWIVDVNNVRVLDELELVIKFKRQQ